MGPLLEQGGDGAEARDRMSPTRVGEQVVGSDAERQPGRHRAGTERREPPGPERGWHAAIVGLAEPVRRHAASAAPQQNAANAAGVAALIAQIQTGDIDVRVVDVDDVEVDVVVQNVLNNNRILQNFLNDNNIDIDDVVDVNVVDNVVIIDVI